MTPKEKLYKLLRNNLTADQAKALVEKADPSGGWIESTYDKMIEVQQEVVPATVHRKYDMEAEDLASKLKDYVIERYPFLERSYKATEWTNEIQRIHKRGHSYGLIEVVMRWVFEESDFWSRNIRSAGKFNKQFETNLLPQVKDVYDASQIPEV